MTDSIRWQAIAGSIGCLKSEPAERLAPCGNAGEPVDCEEFLRVTPATPAQLSEVLQLDQRCRGSKAKEFRPKTISNVSFSCG